MICTFCIFRGFRIVFDLAQCIPGSSGVKPARRVASGSAPEGPGKRTSVPVSACAGGLLGRWALAWTEGFRQKFNDLTSTKLPSRIPLEVDAHVKRLLQVHTSLPSESSGSRDAFSAAGPAGHYCSFGSTEPVPCPAGKYSQPPQPTPFWHN